MWRVAVLQLSPWCGASCDGRMVCGAPLLAVWRIDIIILAHLVRISRSSQTQPAAGPRFALNATISTHPCLRVYKQVRRGRNTCPSLSSRKFPLIVIVIITLALPHRTFWWVYLPDLTEELWYTIKDLRLWNGRWRDDCGDVKWAQGRVWHSTSNLHLPNHSRNEARWEEWIRRWIWIICRSSSALRNGRGNQRWLHW